MRIKVIACKVLCRELSELIAVSKNVIDITWLKQGYHNEPDKLREILQRIINEIDEGSHEGTYCGKNGWVGTAPDEIDAIVLGYGLCSNGVVGLTSKKHTLIIPKAHDCITLFLGSRDRYKQLFDSMKGGAYWYTPGWIENTPMPCEENFVGLKEHYAELYGEDNAEFLLETENNWYRDYKYAAYVKPHNPDYPDYSEFTRKAAQYFNWSFAEYDGDIALLKKIADGNFDDDFLIIPPNHTAQPSYDDEIIKIKNP
ncbi:MAG: DUF1638 domain-containing protein [Clostridia bacterium]|nr:DUF1638 domain-containing protein [Clostridia bacterium]